MTLGAWVDLRVAGYARVPQFAGGERARGHVREQLGDVLAAAEATGAIRWLKDGDRLFASIVHWHDPDSWYGVPTRYVAVDYREEALGWVLDTLETERAAFGADVDFNLLAHQWPVARRLLDWGFGVDVVVLFGDPREALGRLLADRSPVEPASLGLRVEPWSDGPRTQQMIALRSRVFTDEPEFCWFGASPGSLERFREDLRGGEERYWLFIDGDDRLAGYFGTAVRDGPLWGRCGGVDLLLGPSIRGRGLARAAYATILRHQIEAGARVFKGGTSQPPVLHLASLMNRPLCSVVLRRRTPFPLSHFAPYLPP